VGVQIALSVLLLGGAGLFVRTFDNLRHQQVGFQTSNLITFDLDPSSSGYSEARTAQTVVDAAQRLAVIPGVSSVAATTDPELSGDSNGSNFTIPGYHPGEDESMRMETPWITFGYFATLKQPLLLGREFTSADAKDQPKVAVVNLALAKRYFGSAQNAMGRVIAEGAGNVKLDTTIVGVVGDAKHQDLRTEIFPTVYRPYVQREHPGGVVFYVRTAQAPEAIESSIRRTMHDFDATLVVDSLRTMEEQVDRSASGERTLAFLAIGFSSLALLMAAVGLYGVLAYSTEQRTREIGVRLALGAQRSSVMILIVREMVIIAGIATAVALPSVVALARLFSSQLYGVKTFVPLTLGAATLLTALMLALAAALPARRAASIEPTRALRSE
jgi:predicted permease